MCSVSVCIATYNGAEFIRDQLRSILEQIPEDSEVLVGDDGSTDETLLIVEAFHDARIKIIRNTMNLGYIGNFENLIAVATGEYIFLSDQDDLWPPGRVEKMISAMKSSESLMVVGSMESFVDSVDSRKYFCGFDQARNRTPVRNFLDIFAGRSVPYFGCAMLLSKKIKPYLIPFYSKVVSHDIWIAFVANRRNSVFHLSDVVTLRRVHGRNLTNNNRGLFDKVRTRFVWLVAIFHII
ncbi:glycosyltransferase [Pseudomonas sp. p50]|uniref:glycosyltransferase n=1 Tax=Pseudomonas sp. p50(2008) TaxID=2816832 RepID=UPI00188A86CF|nr:glycosyltransferase [Pseudomonas sp. p50(2008)]MBF4555102.1 glycosyltransferase [Pseudomonas sp. p50(2008)]